MDIYRQLWKTFYYLCVVCWIIPANAVIIMTDFGVFDISSPIPGAPGNYDPTTATNFASGNWRQPCMGNLRFIGYQKYKGIETGLYLHTMREDPKGETPNEFKVKHGDYDWKQVVAPMGLSCAQFSQTDHFGWPSSSVSSNLVYDITSDQYITSDAPLGDLSIITLYDDVYPANCPPSAGYPLCTSNITCPGTVSGAIECHTPVGPQMCSICDKKVVVPPNLQSVLKKTSHMKVHPTDHYKPNLHPQSGIPGRYIVMPDMRSPSGQRIFYEERSSSVWTQVSTMTVSHVDDLLTVVKEFDPPDMPDLKEPELETEVKEVMARYVQFITKLTSSSPDQSIGYGLFGAIGCAVDSIFGGSCSGGSNKKATQENSRAISATNDAIRAQEGQIQGLLKSAEGLSKITNNNHDMILQNQQNMKKLANSLTQDITEIAANANDEIKEVLSVIDHVHAYLDFRANILETVNAIEEYNQLILMASGSHPSISSILRNFRGKLPYQLRTIKAKDCHVASSQSVLTGVKLQFVVNLRCSIPDVTYAVFKPSPIPMSQNGKLFYEPASLIQNMILLATDGISHDCSKPVVTPVGTFNLDTSMMNSFGNGGQCLTYRMMATTRESLDTCTMVSESKYTCYPYQVTPVEPPFLDNGPIFPWRSHDHSYVSEVKPRPIFPFVILNSQMAMLTVPSNVYAPPSINNRLPAGTIFSLGAGAGKVIPLPTIYSGTPLASVGLPPAVDSLQTHFSIHTSFIVSSHYNNEAEERLIYDITNKTQNTINHLFSGNAAFQNAIEEYNKNETLTWETLQDQLHDSLHTVSNLQSRVNSTLQTSDELAKQAFQDAKDSVEEWLIYLVLCFALIGTGTGVTALVLIYLMKQAAASPTAAILNSIPNHISSDTTIVPPQVQSAVSLLMPKVIIGLLGIIITQSVIIVIKSMMCSNKRKGLKIMHYSFVTITAASVFIYHLDKYTEFKYLSDIFTEGIMLAFTFTINGLAGAIYLSLLLCSVKAEAGHLFNKVGQNQPTTTLGFHAQAAGHTDQADYDSVSLQRWIFMGLTIFTIVTVIIVLVVFYLFRDRTIPVTWKASWQSRLRSLFTSYCPIGIRIKATYNTIGNSSTTCYELDYFVGWVKDPHSVSEIHVPSTFSKGVRPIITASSSVIKPVIDYFPHHHFVYEQPEQIMLMAGAHGTQFLYCSVKSSDGLKKGQTRNAIKRQSKGNHDEYVAMKASDGSKDHPKEKHMRVVDADSKSAASNSNSTSSSSSWKNSKQNSRFSRWASVPEVVPLSSIYDPINDIVLANELTYPRLKRMAASKNVAIPNDIAGFAASARDHLKRLGYVL